MSVERRKLLAAVGLQAALSSRVNPQPMFVTDAHSSPKMPTETRQWYVDNNLDANGDGVTWGTAWNSLTNIRWDSIEPGDMIYISGGTSGRTYNETLIIGASGAPGKNITVTAGIDDGHSGTVTIDAQGVRSQCVVVGGRNYLTIQNLTIQNTADDANLTVNGAVAEVRIRRIISHSGIGSRGGNCRCFDIRNCKAHTENPAVTLEECIATTPSATQSQTDTLWSSGNDGVLVQYNTFTVANTDPIGHSDCIQSYADFAVTFRCNRLIHPNGGTNNHGFIVSDVQAGGTVLFYNNIVVMKSNPGQAVSQPEIAIFREYLTTGYTGTVNIWNNTVYGGLYGYCTHATAGPMPPDEFKNNIIYTLPISIAPYGFSNGNLTLPANTDYNDVFTSGGNLVVFNQGSVVGAVRSTTEKSSGRVYFEIQLGMMLSSRNTVIGIGNKDARLTAFTGASGDSIGWEWSAGKIYLDGSPVNTTYVTGSAGDVVAFGFDFERRKFWVKNLTVGGTWNGDTTGDNNPVTGAGGYSFGSLPPGPYFIMVSVGIAGDSVILNTGRTAFVGAIPKGYSAWGAATVLNPSDIAAPATLTAPVGYMSGVGYAGWTEWQSLGYDQHSVNADPLFVDSVAEDFRLSGPSPAIGTGVILPMVTMDYGGIPRARSAPYDIGAHAVSI